MKKYLSPKPNSHGSAGPLNIGHLETQDQHLVDLLDIWESSGPTIDTDIGFGSILGIYLCPDTEHAGIHSTSSDLVMSAPTNLQVIQDVR